MKAGTDKNGGLFGGHYEDWRTKRINKIISILGEDFFKDKKVLELGCGWGHIGLHFRKMGAIVTFSDARGEHLQHVKEHSPNSETYQIDQDTNWNLQTKFDLIIHMGVLYHLSNWKQDLRCALEHSNKIILETTVASNRSNNFELSVEESDGWDQALNRKSLRPSSAYLESYLTDLGVKFTRFDDAGLNSGFHKYDWVEDDSTNISDNKFATRRFYLLEK